jgi:hypothetical protein
VLQDVHTCKLNYRNKILIEVRALQGYLFLELVQCDVRSCFVDKISAQIKLYLLIKSDLMCSCGNELRYLDLTYFQNSKKEVKRFLVAVQRTYGIFMSGVILNVVISYCVGSKIK